MGQDLIRYDILAQDALRGVIRKVLNEVIKTGLPGEHHFFITFLTSAPGVRISSRLREKYPELMTIVIQHQYWDLAVTDTTFEVGLSFSDIPERLLIPFAAIRVVCDPAHRALPAFVAMALKPNGDPDIRAVLRALAHGQVGIGVLIRLARDSSAAFAALSRCRSMLGHGLGVPEMAIRAD